MTNYVMRGRVTAVFEKKEQRHIEGVKDAASFEYKSLGWWITVDKLTTFYIGTEKPDLKEGQPISIILQPEAEQPIHPIQAAGELV